MPFRLRGSGLLVAAVIYLVAGVDRAAYAAEVAPEALLAEDSVVYVRFDGFDPHRPAYEKTVLAGLVRTELGPLIQALNKMLFDALGPQVLSERLLRGAPPDELIKLQAAVKQLPNLAAYLKRHGVLVGVEVVAPLAPRFQVTFVFPQGGQAEHRAALLGAVRLAAHLSETSVAEARDGTRTILRVGPGELGPVQISAWQEGEHVVLTIGTEDLKHTLGLVEGQRGNLTANPVLTRIAGFRDYETYARGFVNLDAIIRILEKPFPPAAMIADGLGLKGLESFSFHLGFEGPYQRSTLVLSTPGPRKGLLKLLSPPSEFRYENRPPLPPDISMAAVAGFDFARGYDTVLEVIDSVASVFGPAQAEKLKGQIRRFEQALGIDFRNDLFATLGPTVVEYISTSEGAFIFGLTIAIEVKDEAKLKRTLDTLTKSLPSVTGADVSVRKRIYRGAELNMIEVGERGFPFVPTFAVHKGWLVVSFYPQAVEGYVFRCEEKPRVWQPPELVKTAVEKATGNLEAAGDGSAVRVTAVSVSDPRPTVKQVLSVVPLFVTFARSYAGGGDFDLSLIPNAQAVAEPLSENVSVMVDDGKTVRIESFATLPTLVNLSGLESYALVLFPLLGFGF